MALTQSERVRAVVRWLSGQTGKNQMEIAHQLGYDNKSTFSSFLNGHKTVPHSLPSKLADLDPRINIDFLLGTSDEMLLYVPKDDGIPLKSTNAVPEDESLIDAPKRPENGIFVPSELVQMISDLSTTIKDQQRIITTLVETWAKANHQ